MMISSPRRALAFLAIAPVALATVVGVSAGCEDGLAECTLDSDCDQGQACELSECVPVCSADEDCLENEVCVQGLTTERTVCADDASSGSNTPVRSQFVLVRDVTEVEEGCAAGQPGADLAYVLVEDLNGSIVGWGREAGSSVVMENNDYASSAHISGVRPDAGTDSCPLFDDATVVSLGCGGWIGIEFIDSERNIVTLRGGEQRIRIGEYGAQCTDGDDLDRYEVLLCPDAATADDMPERCTLTIGVGLGERAFGF